jgi:hypothetical protein
MTAMGIFSLFGPTLVAAQQDFSFSSEYSYVDETKILRVLGKVENNSPDVARDIIVTATFYDSAGNSLGTFRRTADIRALSPGEASPFEILFLNQQASGNVANYTLSANATLGSAAKETQFELVSSNSRLDLLGAFYVNAVARNNADQTATNTILIATLYDSDDRVIAIGRALAEAVRGTSDVPAESEAAFGVVIVDKLQTYRASKYSLTVQSDQYVSEEVTFRTAGPGQVSSSGNQTQSECLIATAAYGSAFAPQVQQLREFRDRIAMRTFAGSSFMDSFNTWYYSFSPSVAAYERDSPLARDSVRAVIQPLLAILNASTMLHSALSFAGLHPEAAVVATGLGASALIGGTYLAPVAVLVAIKKKRLFDSKQLRAALAACWILGAVLMTLGTGGFREAMTAGASITVLTVMGTVVLLISDRISRL